MQNKTAISQGKILRRLRTHHFLSQDQMAVKLKIKQQAYSKLERGETNFSYKRIVKICKIFKVPVEELLKDTDKKKKAPSKLRQSYKLKVLKEHYEKLLLEKDIRIGELELELLYVTPDREKDVDVSKLRVMI